MIFFIASVIIALGVIGVLFLNIQSISSAANIGSKILTEQLRTDITVINDPEMIPNSSGVYTFYVKNTGKEELSTSYVNVIIDGVVVPEADLTKILLGGNVVWTSGDVLQINATVSMQSGSHKLRVVADNGVEDEFSFRT